MKIKYLLSILFILFFISSGNATDPTWMDDDSLIIGLVGTNNSPLIVFEYDNSWWLIHGDAAGTVTGYKYVGLGFELNSSIIEGILDVGIRSHPAWYKNGSSFNIIMGGGDGEFQEYWYNGTANVPITTTLTDVGERSAPTAFTDYGITKMIAGNKTGFLTGFVLGANWNVDPTVITGATRDYGGYASPYVLNDSGDLIMVVGDSDGGFNASKRIAGTWTPDASLIVGLEKPRWYSQICLFNASGFRQTIISSQNTAFDGYYYDSYTPPSPLLYTPVNGTFYNVRNVTLTSRQFNDTGLVGWWKMDGDWTDSSDEGNNGTAYGGVNFSFGINNASGSFDGVNDYITTTYQHDLDDVFSISIWINIYDIFLNTNSILGVYTSSTNYWVLRHRADKGGVTLQHTTGASAGYTTPSKNVVQDQWTNIVLVKSDATNVKIYQDGELITNESLAYTGYTSNNLNFGTLSGASNFIIGKLDEIYIYDRALSQLEITQLYQLGREENTSLNYNFYGDTSSATTLLSSLDNETYTWSVPTSDTFYWANTLYDGNYNSNYSYINYFTVLVPPDLSTPTNGSTIYFSYPPAFEDISFTWENVASPSYQIQIAQDSNFNLISSDSVVSTPSTSVSLGQDQYWWKVRSYNITSSTYSDWSEVYNFNLVGNITVENNSVHGVVYASIDGVNTVLSNAKVIISNSTYSDNQIVGSNGYYLFTGLEAGTIYTLQASKDLYLTSETTYINATVDPITKNFFLLPDRTSEEWRHYVKFTVWGFGGYYENIEVIVYESDSVIALYTADTGTDGSVSFIMNKQTKYRITFINASQGINKEINIYPIKDSYLIFIAFTNPWTEYEEPINSMINVLVSTEIINSTAAYINFTYTDSLAETTNVLLYLNQTNQSDIWNQTNLDTHNGLSGNFTSSFIVTNYSGESYFINAIITHTTYGEIKKTYAVGFKDSVLFDGIPAKFFLYLAMFIMIFIAGMFGASSVAPGSMVVCVVGWFFYFIGWFDVIGGTAIIAVGLGFATVISLVANLNKFNKKEGIE